MSATSYGRAKIVDHVTGVASWAVPPLYLSLHTADPGDAGSHANEVTGTGYARYALAGVMGAADADGISVNTVAIDFGVAGSDWGTIPYFGVDDAASAGNMICPGVLDTPRTITTGQPLVIPVGQLRLRVT